MANITASYIDNMALTDTRNGTSSVDRLVLDAENQALKQELSRLRQRTRQLESQDMLREAESAADFTAGQMDRVVYNVRNVNYGMDKLVSAIDVIRRDGVLLGRTEGIELNPNREAVSVIYLGMDQYVKKRKMVSETAALADLMELTGRINSYFDKRSRPADCFAKAGWQDHMFMFVLPATDRFGAKEFLFGKSSGKPRLVANVFDRHERELSIAYGIANYAADVKETDGKEASRAVAIRLLDAAKKIAKEQTSEFSGRIEKEAQYL